MGRKDIEGHSWLSLFFWPAFRRIFPFGKGLGMPRKRRDAWLRPLDLKAEKPAERVPQCAVPQVIIETQLEHWIRWTLESNIELAAALKRLRTSYKLILAGNPATDADAILAQVEAALRTVENNRM
jgi:hypothetical protein